MCCQAFLVSQKSSLGPQEPPGRGLPRERGPRGQILFSQTSFESKLTCRVLLPGAHRRRHAGRAGREGDGGHSAPSILSRLRDAWRSPEPSEGTVAGRGHLPCLPWPKASREDDQQTPNCNFGPGVCLRRTGSVPGRTVPSSPTLTSRTALRGWCPSKALHSRRGSAVGFRDQQERG